MRPRPPPAPAAAHPGGEQPTLTLLDTIVVSAGDVLGTRFGGISGLDYEPRTGAYAAISDRSVLAPARYYTLRLPLDRTGFAANAPVITEVTTLRNTDGLAFAAGTVDPEAIRRLPGTNRLAWTSEGAAVNGVPPFVRETSPDGTFRREHNLPAAYIPVLTGGVPTAGVRNRSGPARQPPIGRRRVTQPPSSVDQGGQFGARDFGARDLMGDGV